MGMSVMGGNLIVQGGTIFWEFKTGMILAKTPKLAQLAQNSQTIRSTSHQI